MLLQCHGNHCAQASVELGVILVLALDEVGDDLVDLLHDSLVRPRLIRLRERLSHQHFSALCLLCQCVACLLLILRLIGWYCQSPAPGGPDRPLWCCFLRLWCRSLDLFICWSRFGSEFRPSIWGWLLLVCGSGIRLTSSRRISSLSCRDVFIGWCLSWASCGGCSIDSGVKHFSCRL